MGDRRAAHSPACLPAASCASCEKNATAQRAGAWRELLHVAGDVPGRGPKRRPGCRGQGSPDGGRRAEGLPRRGRGGLRRHHAVQGVPGAGRAAAGPARAGGPCRALVPLLLALSAAHSGLRSACAAWTRRSSWQDPTANMPVGRPRPPARVTAPDLDDPDQPGTYALLASPCGPPGGPAHWAMGPLGGWPSPVRHSSPAASPE
jgi:hypothetical protein